VMTNGSQIATHNFFFFGFPRTYEKRCKVEEEKVSAANGSLAPNKNTHSFTRN
jgi:hypothetical protein